MNVLPQFSSPHIYQQAFEQISQQYTPPLSPKGQEAFKTLALEASYKLMEISGQNQYTEAIRIASDLANLAHYFHQHRRYIVSTILIQILYQRLGDVKTAIKYGQKGVSLCYELDCGSTLGYAYVQLATSYGIRLEFNKALELYHIGIDYCIKYNDFMQAVGAYTSMSSMYAMCKKHEIAIEQIELALTYTEKANDKSYHHILHFCLADYHFALQHIDQAEQYIQKAFAYLETHAGYDEYQTLDTKAKMYRLSARILLQKKQYQQAIQAMQQSLSIAHSNAFFPWDFTYKGYETIGQAYYQWGNYQQAKEYYEKAIQLFHQETINYTDMDVNVANACTFLSKIYMQLGDIGKAIACTDKTIAENQKFETLLKQHIIEHIEESYDLSLQLKSNQVEDQQEFLRSQMNPHFIFNAVSIIQSLILNQETKKASRYLSKFSHLMRSTLEHSHYKRIPLEEEIKSLKDYLHLQQIRFEPSFQFSITISPTLDIYHVQIPPMLIQPFVENAILHGIKNKADGHITLHFQDLNNSLKCTIEDNGSGITPPKNKKTNYTSRSTQIVQKRLKNLGLEHNVITQLHISNQSDIGKQGTIVTITMPLFKEFEE